MIDIRTCRVEDLELLEKTIPTTKRLWHSVRFDEQKAGRSTYLIAWHERVPVGHLFLKWEGSDLPQVRANLGSCPELNAIGVYPPELRSQGIGRALVAEAERMAAERGCPLVGLGVTTDNPRAERLYRELGYVDWDHGTVIGGWDDLDDDGRPIRIEEEVRFLVKRLRPGGR